MIESSILIVCDEPTTSRVWGLLVTDLHCRPVIASSLSQAISSLEENAPDLILIDVKSRVVNGIEICHGLREHVTTPMLLFTPINNESHTLEAYQAGVDECVIKPVSPDLFLAKVKVWLRRGWTVHVESLEKLQIGKITLEPSNHQLVTSDGKRIRLSNLEFHVLYLLMNHPNQPFSNEELTERVWGFYGGGNSALVKNVIYRLRKKIEPNPNDARYILTETDGYLFRR
jgi:DNA-binding response OmpR family regulator